MYFLSFKIQEEKLYAGSKAIVTTNEINAVLTKHHDDASHVGGDKLWAQVSKSFIKTFFLV